jgi:hypothetical protein
MSLRLYTQAFAKKARAKRPKCEGVLDRVYVSLRDLRRGAAVSSSFSSLSPLLPAAASGALGFLAAAAGFTGAGAAFLPPNRVMKSTLTRTTMIEATIEIVMLGCFSPFSISSCETKRDQLSF